ncbi:MAG: DNA polymerase III subunit beta [Candidatus Omnitrophica bacterium]|nr:DNA polymerase III subunit beta [Candidatus Omnitrophota bacterium]
MNTEQLNIEGKRSGEGFVAHKAILVNALSRALAERLVLFDLTVGRKGFTNYLKALAGSNIIKVVPANGSASEVRTNGHKRVKVMCGAHTSYLEDEAWIKKPSGKGKKVTPLTLCEIRVSPSVAVKPNLGAGELAEALNRVLPFTAKDENRPVLACVSFAVKDGKLILVSADGFRLAVNTLPFDGESEGQSLVSRDDLRGIPVALKRARRIRVGFEPNGSLDTKCLTLETDLIRYKWAGVEGSFPDYEKLIPTEFNTVAHFDTTEAIKAIASLKVLADSKGYGVDLTLDNGVINLDVADDKGHTAIPAEIDGKPMKVRIDGNYLVQALKACGGMVELKLTTSYQPATFITNGYKLVVMPMLTSESTADMKRDNEARAKAEAEAKAQAEVKPPETIPSEVGETPAEVSQPAEAEPTEIPEPAEPVADKPKRKHKAKEPVAV